MKARQSLLSGIGLMASVPAALLPWLLGTRIVPMYESAGVPLPELTRFWLDWWPISLVLPLLVGVIWWRLEAHPQRGTSTAIASAIGAMLVDGFSVIALWVPLLRLPDLAA